MTFYLHRGQEWEVASEEVWGPWLLTVQHAGVRFAVRAKAQRQVGQFGFLGVLQGRGGHLP